VAGDVDIDKKKSVLNSLIKKMEVNQDGLVEVEFCVALGNPRTRVIFYLGISNGTKSLGVFNDSRHWLLYRTYQVILK